jgi:hypothetical protein
MSRRSYGGLMRLPVWRLDDAAGKLVAMVRAESAERAREVFHRHNLKGARVRRIGR